MHKGTMRRLTLALMGATMFGTAAMAADISRPVYKAPPAGALPVAYDWTGFYIGGHVGWGWAKKNWTDSFGLFDVSHDADGFLGGGQVGFNYQVNQFVFGVEGDFSAAGIKGGTGTGTVIGAAPFGATFDNKIDWTATLTGRVGLAFDRWLVYGKGGVAWAKDKFTTNAYTFPAAVDLSDTRVGWTVGAGLEYAFAPNWSTKLEYNYMDFGSRNVAFVAGRSTEIDQQVHVIKAGINYKFFGGGPVVARY